MAQLNRIRLVADTVSGRLAMVLALLILPPVILSLFLAWNTFTEQKARAKLQVRQFATLTATYESKFFDDVRKILQQLGNEEAIRDSGAGCDAVLEAVQERTPQFASIGYFDINGQKICGSNDDFDDVTNRAWLREVRRFRSFAISNYTVTPNSFFPVIEAAQAVYGPDGQLLGVLAASIRLYWLSAFIREISLPNESVVFLIDDNGNVLADRAAILNTTGPSIPENSGTTAGLGLLTTVVDKDVAAAILTRSLIDFEAVGPDNIRRVFSSVALPHGGATVLFGMPAASSFGWLEKDLFYRVLGLAAIVLAGIGAAWFGTRYLVTRWTSSLRGMARAYGQGNYAPKPNFAKAPRELRDLGETLAIMAQRIAVREEELRASLNQKDIILREIHHRVKNNLQIVSSLLNIRTGSVISSAGQSALSEVKAHVRALALVHRHLYENDDVEQVDLRSFMTELCQSTLAGLSSPSQRVSLAIDIPEFMISTDRAIAIALLVTEAMTNSLKHAFQPGQPGRIFVSFAREGDRSGTLSVADDGVGISPALPDTGGIGLQLIKAFAKQIGGRVTISGPPGTCIRVTIGDVSDGLGDEVDEGTPETPVGTSSAA